MKGLSNIQLHSENVSSRPLVTSDGILSFVAVAVARSVAAAAVWRRSKLLLRIPRRDPTAHMVSGVLRSHCGGRLTASSIALSRVVPNSTGIVWTHWYMLETFSVRNVGAFEVLMLRGRSVY